MALHHFHMTTRVVYGDGVLERLPQYLQELNIRRPLLVTDPGIQKAGLADQVLRYLGADTAVFADVPPETSIQATANLVRAADAAQADGLVALGGGSVMDTAKAINLVGAVGPNLSAQRVGPSAPPVRPLVAIPTTAGTGSEVSPFTVIRDEEHDVKYPLSDERLLPDLALMVPELTLGLPPKMTAATGMDALTHAIESYVSTNHNSFSDPIALAAMTAIAANLPVVMREPRNLAARSAMLVASCQAGIAFGSALLGAAHAVSHALGAHFHVPHGVGNAVMLPWVMNFNLPVATSRLADVSRAIGAAQPGDSDEAAARRAVEAVRQLNRQLGIPERVRELGVKPEDLDHLAAQAFKDPILATNPRPCTEADLRALLQEAY